MGRHRHGRTVVAAAALAAVLAACSYDSGVHTTQRSDPAVPGDTVPDSTDATVPDTTEPVSTDPVDTTVPADTTPATDPPETTTTAPPATTSAPDVSVVDGEDTEWISGPQEGDPEVITADFDCNPFFDAIGGAPYDVAECGPWSALGGQRVWTVTKGASGLFFAVVWQQGEPGVWTPALRLLEPAPDFWEDVNLLAGNIDTGENEELVAGIHLAGTGNFLTVEVIDIRDGSPEVVARVENLHHGRGELATEGVYLYTAGFEDPECCPTSFDQFLLASADDGWVLAEGFAGAPPESIPASDI